MILGAYLLVATSAGITSDPLIAIALTAVFSIIVGLSVYLLLMREMTGQPVLAAVLTTVALGILLRGAMVLIWGPQQLNVASMLSFENASVVLTDSIRVSTASLWLVICTVVVYLGLLAFLHMSRWGMRMRASGQNPLLAAQRGINLHTVYALAWTLSTFSGSIAGVLVALDSRLDVNMAVIGLKAFPAALVGGLDLIVLLALVPLVASPFHLDIASQIFIAAIGALALMVLTGIAGQISLGHGGLMAAGAFTTGILYKETGAGIWITLPASVVAGAVIGLIFGLPSLRLRGVYLAMSTLALHFVGIYLGGE